MLKKSNMNNAIVAIAYNRPDSLMRLLNSLNNSDIDETVTLYISIDYSGDNTCEDVAKEFEWKFGNKKIIVHKENIGLKQNVLASGDLSKNYDLFFMFEDDIVVSPSFYKYAKSVYSYFGDDISLAGYSLYSPIFNEVAEVEFNPIKEGYDNYFMQVPSSLGQFWTNQQWKKFTDWLKLNDKVKTYSKLPDYVVDWPSSSWKKHFYYYLAINDKTIVYPIESFSANVTIEPGEHVSSDLGFFNPELSLKKDDFRFNKQITTINDYDTYFEFTNKLSEQLLGLDNVEFDIYGSKNLDQIESEYLLSIKDCKKIFKEYDLVTFPLQINIITNNKDVSSKSPKVYLGKKEDFSNEGDIDLNFLINRVPSKYQIFIIKNRFLKFALGTVERILN